MTALVAFMNGTVGRWLRLLLGIALIVYGLLVFGGTTGVVIAAIGLVPIVMGLWGPLPARAVCAPSQGDVLNRKEDRLR